MGGKVLLVHKTVRGGASSHVMLYCGVAHFGNPAYRNYPLVELKPATAIFVAAPHADEPVPACVPADPSCLHVCVCVQVKWMEMPGSKIRASSIVHMAFELAVIKLAYQWLRTWTVKTDTDDKGVSSKQQSRRLKAA